MFRSLLAMGCVGLALTGCSQGYDEEERNIRFFIEPVVQLSQHGQVVVALSDLDAVVDPTSSVEQAALDIKTSIESQLPCADVVATGATLDIDYGVKAGNCSLRGMTLKGKHSMTISSNSMAMVEVDHSWKGLTSGPVTLNGEGKSSRFGGGSAATVSFSLSDVDADGATTPTHSGVWTIGPATDEPGFTAQSDNSNFQMINVAFRWGDPVPHRGMYIIQGSRTTTNPGIPTDTFLFERIDETTIQVTWEDRKLKYHVAADGAITPMNQ